ncbi:MAG: zf-HC2 domain-containing protein [Ignavibacteriales bacterium]|nr:zf-HC2 domain-containing protein [Ignavibacteriales bacterium]
MKTEEIFELIPFYLAGTLSKEEKEEFEAELRLNEELKKEISFWRKVKSAAILHNKHKEHASTDEIALYINGELSEDSNQWKRIENHLATCDICRDEAIILKKYYPKDGFVRKMISILENSATEFFEHSGELFKSLWQKPMRLVYVSASLIIITVGILYLPSLMKTSTGTGEIRISYLSVNRGDEDQYAEYTISAKDTAIDFIISIPYDSASSNNYSYRLDGDSGKTTLLSDVIIPSGQKPNEMVFLKINLSSTIFRTNGPFIMRIFDKLDNGIEKIYDYPFIIRFE